MHYDASSAGRVISGGRREGQSVRLHRLYPSRAHRARAVLVASAADVIGRAL